MTKQRSSLRKAIDQHCRDCIYDPNARGAWREQVTACTSPNCALYPVRPLSKAASACVIPLKDVS